MSTNVGHIVNGGKMISRQRPKKSIGSWLLGLAATGLAALTGCNTTSTNTASLPITSAPTFGQHSQGQVRAYTGIRAGWVDPEEGQTSVNYDGQYGTGGVVFGVRSKGSELEVTADYHGSSSSGVSNRNWTLAGRLRSSFPLGPSGVSLNAGIGVGSVNTVSEIDVPATAERDAYTDTRTSDQTVVIPELGVSFEKGKNKVRVGAEYRWFPDSENTSGAFEYGVTYTRDF